MKVIPLYREVLTEIFFGANWTNLTGETLLENKELISTALDIYLKRKGDRTIASEFKVPISTHNPEEIWNMFLEIAVVPYYEFNEELLTNLLFTKEICNATDAWLGDTANNDPHAIEPLNDLRKVIVDFENWDFSNTFNLKIQDI